MKQTILLFGMSLFLFSACKKKDSSSTTPTSTDPCKGKNLCFKLDGTQMSQDAKWIVIRSTTFRIRVYWEEGTGSTYKNIEIDIYGDSLGTYSFNSAPKAGQAGFQYYENGGKNISAVSGTIKLTKNDGKNISATFELDGKDGSTTYKITEGNIVNVAK